MTGVAIRHDESMLKRGCVRCCHLLGRAIISFFVESIRNPASLREKWQHIKKVCVLPTLLRPCCDPQASDRRLWLMCGR